MEMVGPDSVVDAGTVAEVVADVVDTDGVE